MNVYDLTKVKFPFDVNNIKGIYEVLLNSKITEDQKKNLKEA